MIKKNKIVKWISSWNSNNPINNKRNNPISWITLTLIILIMHISTFLRIYDIHQQSSQQFNHQKLQHIFFTSISKIFSLLPMSQLIWFLTIIYRKEMMDLLLFTYHYYIHLFILHLVLNMIMCYLVTVVG